MEKRNSTLNNTYETFYKIQTSLKLKRSCVHCDIVMAHTCAVFVEKKQYLCCFDFPVLQITLFCKVEETPEKNK